LEEWLDRIGGLDEGCRDGFLSGFGRFGGRHGWGFCG
jgi:hypothetical protein